MSQHATYLPAEKADNNPVLAPTMEVQFRGQGEMILVVDDEAGVRGMACAVLRRLNFMPVTANDGADGLLQAAKYRTDLRAIVTDLHMPHMDGLSFIRVLRQTLPDMPVLVTSGLLEEADLKKFDALEVTKHLDKPFTEKQLAAALEEIFTPR